MFLQDGSGRVIRPSSEILPPLPAVSNLAPAGQSLGKDGEKGTKKGLYPCSSWQLSPTGLGLFRRAAISG